MHNLISLLNLCNHLVPQTWAGGERQHDLRISHDMSTSQLSRMLRWIEERKCWTPRTHLQVAVRRRSRQLAVVHGSTAVRRRAPWRRMTAGHLAGKVGLEADAHAASLYAAAAERRDWVTGRQERCQLRRRRCKAQVWRGLELRRVLGCGRCPGSLRRPRRRDSHRAAHTHARQTSNIAARRTQQHQGRNSFEGVVSAKYRLAT